MGEELHKIDAVCYNRFNLVEKGEHTMKMDYKTLTLKDMLDYVKANHNKIGFDVMPNPWNYYVLCGRAL